MTFLSFSYVCFPAFARFLIDFCTILAIYLYRFFESYAPAKVDSGYAFGCLHRLTVALCDSNDKALVDCELE